MAAYSVKISADKQDEYHRQKGEICTVVRLYEDSKEFIGPSIPSNDMLIPGDKMYQKRLFVVLRHEKVYDVSIDSVSSKRVTVSFVSNPPSDEKLVIHYETSHLVERAVARKLEDIRYVNLIEKGDTVYLYKNHLMFK